MALAHDLRSPLCVIEFTVRLIQEKGADRQTLDDGLQRIQRATQRASRLVQDLFDLAARERRMFDVRLATLPAWRLLAEAKAIGEALTSNTCMTLAVEQPSHLPAVRVDKDRIVRVFENLIGNAIKFTPRGGRITIRALTVDDEVHFKVADSGVGLCEEERALAFQPYWQHDRTDRHGLGLGLWICREIIEAHGGRIWIEAGDAGGTTVTVALPGTSDTV